MNEIMPPLGYHAGQPLVVVPHYQHIAGEGFTAYGKLFSYAHGAATVQLEVSRSLIVFKLSPELNLHLGHVMLADDGWVYVQGHEAAALNGDGLELVIERFILSDAPLTSLESELPDYSDYTEDNEDNDAYGTF